MAAKGQVIDSAGLTLVIEELEPELLVMDASYEADAQMPPVHYHPNPHEGPAHVRWELRSALQRDPLRPALAAQRA